MSKYKALTTDSIGAKYNSTVSVDNNRTYPKESKNAVRKRNIRK